MSKLSPLFQLRNYILDSWIDDRKYFLGRVLTIVDASISDKEQRKGIKNLINEAFWDSRHREYFVREILLNFSKKFCPDQYPKIKEDEDAFKGEKSSSELEKSEPDYFNQ